MENLEAQDSKKEHSFIKGGNTGPCASANVPNLSFGKIMALYSIQRAKLKRLENGKSQKTSGESYQCNNLKLPDTFSASIFSLF